MVREDTMEGQERLTSTYHPAPWRKQWQVIGLIGAILVFVALVILIYMTVTARTASVGREIQNMQRLIEAADRQIEDLRAELGRLYSVQEMEKRAFALGYQYYNVDQAVYLHVPGYYVEEETVFAPLEREEVVPAQNLPPEYTESVLDWLKRKLALLFAYLWGGQS